MSVDDSDRVDPFDVNVRARADMDDLIAHYGEPERALEAGDYTLVTRWPGVSSALLGKAYLLLGRPEKGLTLLEGSGSTDPEDKLYLAFALWSLDRTDEAVGQLDELLVHRPEHVVAQRFRELLQDVEIPVLLCGSVSMQVAPYLQKASGFRVTTTGFADYWDLPCTFETSWPDVAAALPQKPLFGLSIGPETFTPPTWLADAPFTTFGFILDYDVTCTSKYHQNQAFDCLLTYSSGEHYEVSRFYQKRACTFAAFSYTPDISEKADQIEIDPQPARDVLFTGYAFDPLFYRKARFLYGLSQVDDGFDVLINQNDFRLSIGEYLGHLAAAQLVPTFIRWPGTISTRAVEALHLGKGVLVQRNGYMGTVLDGGERDGLFEYGYRTLDGDLRHALSRKPDGARYRRQAKAAFSAQDSAVRLLKFCAFMTLKGGFGSRSGGANRLASCGMHFECETDPVGFHQQLTALNTAREDVVSWIDAGTAAIYNHARLGSRVAVDDVFAAGLQRFPKTAVLRLNYGRFLFHVGDLEAAATHFEVLTVAEDLQHDPLAHDVLTGQVFHKQDFPYGHYQDQVVEDVVAAHQRGTRPDPANTLNMLRSAAWYYLAKIHMTEGRLQAAVRAGEAGLSLCDCFFAAAAQMVRLYHLSSQGSAQRLLFWFDRAVAGYPPYLHELIGPALEANARLQRVDAFTALTDVWQRFFRRVRHNFDYLPLSDELLMCYRRHRSWFSPSIQPQLDRLISVTTWIKTGFQGSIPKLGNDDVGGLCAWLRAQSPDLKLLTRLVAACPAGSSVDALLLFGAERANELGENAAAAQYATAYLEAEAAYPQRTKIYNVAVALKQRGDLLRAHDLFKRLAADGFDRLWLLHFHMAETLLESDPRRAVVELETALAIFPDFIKARKLLERLQTEGV